MNVAIVGASGAVGQEFLRVLDERNFPIDELYLFARAAVPVLPVSSAGKSISLRNLSITTTFATST